MAAQPKFTIKPLFILFAFIFTFYILHFTFLTPAFAQTTGQTPGLPLQPTTYNLPTTVSPTSPLYTDLLVNNLFHSFSCLAIGQSTIGQPCLTYLQGVPVLSKVNTTGGVLGSTTNLIGMLYQNPPVRTADYLASVGQGLGLVKVANAQVGGSGAAVLNPILQLWQTSRNISYVFMIIIFLVIGLMVMFRNKLNPQTVITAQTALPGLVIGLIMITFSYFFAGLISDMAFVGTNVVGYYFASAQGPDALRDPDRTNLVQKLTGTNVLKIFGSFVGIVKKEDATQVYNSIYDELGSEVQGTIKWFTGFMAFQMAGPIGGVAGPYALIIGPIIGAIAGVGAAFNVFDMVGFIIHFIAVFVLIFAMLKLLIRLINSYLTIIFLTITAPFQFLFASLPGRQGMATGWILNMLANILIFPAVIAVFYFVAIILGPSHLQPDFPLKVSSANQIQNNSFTPAVYAQEPINIVDTTTFPLFGGMNLDFVKILLAFGALVALPAIPDIIVKAIGKAGQAGQMLGQEISGGVRAGQGYASGYSGNIAKSVQSTSTGIMGERQLIMGEKGWEKRPVKYGLRDIKNPFKR